MEATRHRPSIRPIGFVGLGNMGLPIVSRLVAAGYAVLGLRRRARRAAHSRLSARQQRRVPRPRCRRGVDALILMLPDSTIVASVMSDAGLLAAAAAGSIVDMGSSEPLADPRAGGRLDALGVALVDAPVSGGVSGAVKGTLTIMVGGARRPSARVTPVLELLGTVRHAGAVGSGHAIKALNNLISATHLWATSEAILPGSASAWIPRSCSRSSTARADAAARPRTSGRTSSSPGLRLRVRPAPHAEGHEDGGRLAGQLGVPVELGYAAVERWAEAADALAPKPTTPRWRNGWRREREA